jgi:hypothetical protein
MFFIWQFTNRSPWPGGSVGLEGSNAGIVGSNHIRDIDVRVFRCFLHLAVSE